MISARRSRRRCSADPSAPGSLTIRVEVDRGGDLHLTWGNNYNLYYARSVHGAAFSTGRPSEPQFLPAQRLWAEDGRFSYNASVDVDDAGWVSIAYVATDHTVAFTRAYQGLDFPPSRMLADQTWHLQLAVSPDGPVTVVYEALVGSRSQKILSAVAMDGVNFQGPFELTHLNGGLYNKKCVRAGPNGRVYAAWVEQWVGMGWESHLTYRESYDYGRSFVRRDLVWDNRVYPGAFNPALAITPDGFRCIVEAQARYSQCR
ncbi:MAG: hypothetical protein U1E76_03340 [Planctomycetota bacterium]